jgi:4-diphosphocytidyl-2-C-methyl-D-erythritol kinase
LALNYLWQCQLPIEKLAELGLTLGADVPVFVRGFAAFAQGIGEKLQPVSINEPWYLITCPNVHISTAEVFDSPELGRNTAKISLADLDLNSCQNDCQDVVIKHYPEVAKVLTWLLEYAPSKMTGTGACLFSIFTTENEARQVQEKLPQGIQSFVAKGCNQSALHSVLSQLA